MTPHGQSETNMDASVSPLIPKEAGLENMRMNSLQLNLTPNSTLLQVMAKRSSVDVPMSGGRKQLNRYNKSANDISKLQQ